MCPLSEIDSSRNMSDKYALKLMFLNHSKADNSYTHFVKQHWKH